MADVISSSQLGVNTPFRKPKHWKAVFIFSVFAILFWLVELWYQYKVLLPGELGGSLVRGSALAGATLVGFALFSSAVFRWFPRTAKYWRIRRYLGVSGFIFILLHVLAVYNYYFNFNLKSLYYSFNPFENPIIFGSVSYLILFVIAITSSDWMVDHIGSKRWKFIHRFVYLAYLSAIFHFLNITSFKSLQNPAGYLLLVITGLAVLGEIMLFFKVASKRRFRSLGSFVGIGLILLAGLLAYFSIRY